jgi:hypothetical protein
MLSSSVYGKGIDACCSLKGHSRFFLVFPEFFWASDLYFNAVLRTFTFSYT